MAGQGIYVLIGAIACLKTDLGDNKLAQFQARVVAGEASVTSCLKTSFPASGCVIPDLSSCQPDSTICTMNATNVDACELWISGCLTDYSSVV